MPHEGQTSLSPYASDALEHLQQATLDTASLSPDQAVSLLEAGPFERADADIALSELLAKGYLYKVGSTLYFTQI